MTTYPSSWPPPDARGVPRSYAALGRRDAVIRVVLADGREGWLVTRLGDVRKVLCERHFAQAPLPLNRATGTATARVLTLLHASGEQHRRLRRVLMRCLDRRVACFEPRVAAIVEHCLARVVASGPPADLVSAFAVPVALQVTGELLGLDDAHGTLLLTSAELISAVGPRPQAETAAAQLLRLLAQEVAQRRQGPADDLLGDLVHDAAGLSDQEAVELGAIVLVAGCEAPANMISCGAALFFDYPEARHALLGTAEDQRRAVEELLRHVSVIQYGVDRVAVDDVVLSGQLIRRGDTVIALLPAANWDEDLVPSPETLDVSRPVCAHVAFGHGPHACLGQGLARMTLQTALQQLFTRLPALTPAGGATAAEYRDGMVIGGYHRLPVTW